MTLLSYLGLRIYIKYAKEHGITAPDVHKTDKPEVVDDAGNILPFILLLFFLPPLCISNLYGDFKLPLGIFLTGILGGSIGFIDDRRNLGLFKVPLMLLAGLPLLFLGVPFGYSPKPIFPIIGRTRLTIVYPLILCIIITVISNGVNMIDVVNGSALMQSIFAVITIAFWSLLLILTGNSIKANLAYFIYALIFLGLLTGFFLLNKYPSRIFLGNSGAYGIGTILAALVIISQKEFVTMITLIPLILNSFVILSSLRGLKTKEKFADPVKIKNGVIFPNDDENAPLTLVGLRASINPVKEREVIQFFLKFFLMAFLLSFITGILIYFPNLLDNFRF